jgi:uncharacterized protein (TIGR02246 family)
MKARSILYTLLLTLLSATVSFAGTKPGMNPTLWKKIADSQAALQAAIRSGNGAQAASFYADDATLMTSAGEKLKGRKAIAEYYTQHPQPGLKLDVKEVGGSGEVIYQLASLTTTGADGQAQNRDVVLLWKKQADWSYKIYVDSGN